MSTSDDPGASRDEAVDGVDDAPAPTSAPARPWLRRLGISLGLLGVIALPMCGRVAYEGQAELAAADRARDAADVDEEIVHLGRAARWRMPILSHDETARARLMEIGRAAQAEGEDSEHVALAAFREVRRALWATRTLGVVDDGQLREANEAIATLMAAQETRFATNVSGADDPQAWHLEQLSTPPGPVPWRATAAALAFVLWIVATAGFVLRGLDAAGRLRPRAAVRWGAASLVTLAAWAWLLVRVRG